MPRVEMERIAREFLSLEQTMETIPELNRKFTEMALFCPQYAANEEMKVTRYLDVLRTDIREFVITMPFTTLAALMQAARRRELELETQARKRKAVQVVAPVSMSAKKSKSCDLRASKSGSEYRLRDDNSGRPVRCYRCGHPGHLSQDCDLKGKVCYYCGQEGHVKTNCPSLKARGGRGASQVVAAT